MKASAISRFCAMVMPLTALSSVAGLPLLHKAPKTDTAGLRAQYIADLTTRSISAPTERTAGSIWSPDGRMSDLSADYKASHLGDSLTVIVAVQTTAAQSGSVDSERNFSTNSAIGGAAAKTLTTSTDPLLTASSATTLKGTGSTNSSTAFSTSLTGQVIAVLPTGSLVVEAHRIIEMNHQREEVIMRGVARPGDISSQNSVPSSSLSELQIELKGKGIISDSVRSPNPLTRAVLWLLGF